MTNCSTICFRKRSCDTLKKLRTMLGKKRRSNIIVRNNRTLMKLCQIDNPANNSFLVRSFQSLDRRPDGVTGSVVRYLDQHVIMAKCDAHFVNDERCGRRECESQSPGTCDPASMGCLRD